MSDEKRGFKDKEGKFIPTEKAFQEAESKNKSLQPPPIKIPLKEKIPTKDRKISFRVTEHLYKDLDQLAKQNNVSLSVAIESCIEGYIKLLSVEFYMAQYFFTYKNLQESITNLENQLPAGFRKFTNAVKKYPNAGILPDYLMKEEDETEDL